MSIEMLKINQKIGEAIQRQLYLVEQVNKEDPDGYRAASVRGRLAGLREAYEIIENSVSGCF